MMHRNSSLRSPVMAGPMGAAWELRVDQTATSFARALQRSYELAWRLPPAGLRAAWRPLALVIGLAIYVDLLFLGRRRRPGR